MKIYDLRNQQGCLYAFEISNSLITRGGVCKLVRALSGARILSGRRELRRADEFCVFEVQGQKFKAWEPFGDNSRFWIGPEPVEPCEQLSTLRNAFAQHSFLDTLMNNFMSLMLVAVVVAAALTFVPRQHTFASDDFTVTVVGDHAYKVFRYGFPFQVVEGNPDVPGVTPKWQTPWRLTGNFAVFLTLGLFSIWCIHTLRKRQHN